MPRDTLPAPTTPLPTFTPEPEGRWYNLRGPAMRLADFDTMPAGTVLLLGYSQPVEYLSIETVTRQKGRYNPTPTQVRYVRIRYLDPASPKLVGTTDLVPARELHGLWEDYAARCVAEQAARQPTIDAAATLGRALARALVAGRVSPALTHPGGDHADDVVHLELRHDQALALASQLPDNEARLEPLEK